MKSNKDHISLSVELRPGKYVLYTLIEPTTKSNVFPSSAAVCIELINPSETHSAENYAYIFVDRGSAGINRRSLKVTQTIRKLRQITVVARLCYGGIIGVYGSQRRTL